MDVVHGPDLELALELLGLQSLQVMKGQRFAVLLREKASCFSMITPWFPVMITNGHAGTTSFLQFQYETQKQSGTFRVSEPIKRSF